MLRSSLAGACAPAVLALAGLVAAPVASHAQGAGAELAAAVAKALPRAIEYRRDIHQHPELGNRETRTAQLVADRLRALGVEVQTGVAGTGVIGTLRGGKPGPLIAVRADMDALPVLEDTDLPFKSTATAEYEGRTVPVSHACGHDIHVAVQLGVAEVLAARKATLAGTVQFIFQPAEEGPPKGEAGGAKRMLDEGLWGTAKPEAVFGLHAYAHLPVGEVAYTPGPAMAGSLRWQATLTGRSAHGAQPHRAIDPVVMAAEAVMALQTIRSRTLSPFTPSVVTVGRLVSGTRNNIIPESAELDGTVRYFSDAVRDTITGSLRNIFDGVTRMHGGSFAFTSELEAANPPLVNDDALTAFAIPVLERAIGKAKVSAIEATTGAEDFAHFARATKGFFFRIGSLKPGTTTGDHHTPTFRADDGAVAPGITAMSALVLAYLERGTRK